MKQDYFYITLTDENDSYDAHELNKSMNIRGMRAWNKGDICEENPNILFQKTCLYISSERYGSEDFFFTGLNFVNLLNAPQDLIKTLHFVANPTTDSQCHGCFLDENRMKSLALLDANFKFHAKLHFLPQRHEYPNSEYIKPIDMDTNYEGISTRFRVFSYSKTLDEISNKLGFKHNDRSFNYDDIRKNSGKPYGWSMFLYSKDSKLHDETLHLDRFVNELYQYKDKILAIGNEIDCSYRMSITGSMPNEYELEISADTLRKLAEMRITLDFDMYFLNNY